MPKAASRMTASDLNVPPEPKQVVGLGIERVRKITIDRAAGKPSPMAEGEPTRWLLDLYCLITDVKIEQGSYGPYNRWLGEIRTVNLEDGSILESATLILPPIADDLLTVEWKKTSKAGGNALIAMRIGVEPPPPPKPGQQGNQAGYVYTCININPHSGSSPLDLLYAAANPAPNRAAPPRQAPNAPAPAQTEAA